MSITKIIFSVFIAVMLVASLGAGYASAQGASTCKARADISGSLANDLLGVTGHAGVVSGDDLALVGTEAGNNGLLCTYALILFLTNFIKN